MLTVSALGPWWVSFKSSAKEMGLLPRIPLYSVAAGLVILAGLAREMVVASTFGLSGDLDVLVAVMGFHLLFGVQVGNAIEHVFVSKMASQHRHHLKLLVRQASFVLLVINVVTLTALVLGSGPVLRVIFPEFTMEQLDTGTRLTRLLLFPIACAGLAGLLRGGLAIMGSFAPVFLGGAIVSLTTIISVTAFADQWGIDAMVWGFATGHFLVLTWFTVAFGLGHVPSSKAEGEDPSIGVGVLWRPVLIVLFGEFLFQAIVMTERSFASGLGTGKIAAFFYAGSVIAAPLALFTTPVNTTLFPKLARAFHTGYREGRALLTRYGALLFVGALLFSVALALGAEPIIEMALVRGKFSMADAQTTAHILSILVWALPFASLYGVIRNSFYSLTDYRTPVLGYGIKWLALVLCAGWLVPSLGVDGLALASVAAQVTDTGVMGWLLQRRLAETPEGP
ncbi:MAG: polysaccharide biosynthesis C-terminal domain-containing protein [Nitrospira sp.]|nr:polysaccharide biosynthesis C-terminal domain-containing protein [Nitrospira sp.]